MADKVSAETSESAGKMRLDKWLWAVRFFKTRGLASEAVAGGRVHVDGVRVKPARSIRVGQMLEISKGPYTFVVCIEGLLSRRGPASIACTKYRETEQSEAARTALEQRLRIERAALRGERQSGRPSKRDRRELQKLRGRDES